MVLGVLGFFVEQCQNLIQPFHTGIVLKSSFEMEFFKFLHCAWVYSFRVVYAVLGYACVTPKKTQKDRDYPLTSGTNPLISYILLTIFFEDKCHVCTMQVCLLQRSGKFRSKFSLVTFSPKKLGNLLMISALVSKMC